MRSGLSFWVLVVVSKLIYCKIKIGGIKILSDAIELKIRPVKQLFYSEESNYGIYACETDERGKVKYNTYGNFSIKGNTIKLTLDQEYSASILEKKDNKYGVYYEIERIYEDIPTDVSKQRKYLESVLTLKQVEQIYKAYPDENVIELITNDQLDIKRVKGLGDKNYKKVRNKIIENLEYQLAFEFLGDYGVTPNTIIKLVKYYKSSKLIIHTIKNNPYAITSVGGIGFKKADAIAMSMGYNSNGEFRILAAIQHVIEEDGNNGHTYSEISDVIEKVIELTGIEISLIEPHIVSTDEVLVLDSKVCLKKYYNAEQSIAERLKEILSRSNELNFNVDEFIKKQEEKHGIVLTDQQKSFFYNVKKYNANLLVGYAGCGKTQMTTLLIDLLEELNITYRLASPTGKAAKILSHYTQRQAETIHRAIGMGEEDSEQVREIDEEYLIVDETSMVDVLLCNRLLKRTTNDKLRILFIGDDFQLPSVGSGRVLYDMINSNSIPMTKLDIVFRQKEGGILQIATMIRQQQKFISNSDSGIFEFGNNCIVASVPQDKMEGGYKYYLNQLLNTYSSNEITVATPTKKSNLGTIEINKHIQSIINPKSKDKLEKKYGYDEIFYRVGDIVINTKNSYKIKDVNGHPVDIVNGDTGKIIKVDMENDEIHVDFEFTVIPFAFSNLGQLLHCWALTIHKLQGSSNEAIIVVADKSHKYQLDANLLYTAVTRSKNFLVIVSQAETINFAMRKIANLRRNTFLQDFLVG
jgi:exodeoxyribonuclease V alpha subunit